MTKRFFAPVLPCLAGIAATLLIGGSPAMAASATPATHPNVVILLIDDMGYGDISAHRSKWLSMIRWSGRRWRTPHIESILVSFLIASLVAPSVVSANSPGESRAPVVTLEVYFAKLLLGHLEPQAASFTPILPTTDESMKEAA